MSFFAKFGDSYKCKVYIWRNLIFVIFLGILGIYNFFSDIQEVNQSEAIKRFFPDYLTFCTLYIIAYLWFWLEVARNFKTYWQSNARFPFIMGLITFIALYIQRIISQGLEIENVIQFFIVDYMSFILKAVTWVIPFIIAGFLFRGSYIVSKYTAEMSNQNKNGLKTILVIIFVMCCALVLSLFQQTVHTIIDDFDQRLFYIFKLYVVTSSFFVSLFYATPDELEADEWHPTEKPISIPERSNDLGETIIPKRVTYKKLLNERIEQKHLLDHWESFYPISDIEFEKFHDPNSEYPPYRYSKYEIAKIKERIRRRLIQIDQALIRLSGN